MGTSLLVEERVDIAKPGLICAMGYEPGLAERVHRSGFCGSLTGSDVLGVRQVRKADAQGECGQVLAISPGDGSGWFDPLI